MWIHSYHTDKEKFTKPSHNGPTKKIRVQSHLLMAQVDFPQLPLVPHLRPLTTQVFKVHQVTAHYHFPQKDLQNFTPVQSFLQHAP